MPNPIQTVPTPWEDVILVCKKCSKKLKGGFGPDGDATLRGALTTELRRTGRRRAVRIIETKCLGLCPKRAVAVIGTPATTLIVPIGTDSAAILANALRPRLPLP
jgi:predicted metal-binding protein